MTPEIRGGEGGAEAVRPENASDRLFAFIAPSKALQGGNYGPAYVFITTNSLPQPGHVNWNIPKAYVIQNSMQITWILAFIFKRQVCLFLFDCQFVLVS